MRQYEGLVQAVVRRQVLADLSFSEALQAGLAVIEAGHDATEWPLTRALATIVSRTPGMHAHEVVLDRIDYPWWIA